MTIHKKPHVGVYGIIQKDLKILVIRKSRGPYTGLYDLPGGRPNYGEDILKALQREIEEETGILAKDFSLFGNFSFFIPYHDSLENKDLELYHIALIYKVKDFDLNSFNDSIHEEDVAGCLWIRLQDIDQKNSSPLVLKIQENLDL